MKRLINADALYEFVQKEKAWKQDTMRRPKYDQGKYDAYYDMLKIIESQPTVDAVGVAHAHWIFTDEAWLLCSNCGHGVETFAGMNSMYRTPYCPYCGARMNEQRKV